MNSLFEEPKFEVVALANEDIIQTSDGKFDPLNIMDRDDCETWWPTH